MDYTNTNTNTIDQIPAMNGSNSHGGERRSRDTDVSSSNSSKRRKFDSYVQENVVIQRENDVSSPEDNVSSAESGDHAVTSSYLKQDLSLDLKSELRFVTETSMSSNDGFSRETSNSSSEICLDSDEMESSSTLKPNPPPLPAATPQFKHSNNPTAAEIEAFFTVMESKEHKRFVDKYNYDIVNDVPMDGRYQWVLLKP